MKDCKTWKYTTPAFLVVSDVASICLLWLTFGGIMVVCTNKVQGLSTNQENILGSTTVIQLRTFVSTEIILPSTSVKGVMTSSSIFDNNRCLLHCCDENAVCQNIPGSYLCVCKNGFTGDGNFCREINECDSSPCRADQVCLDLVGSYECRCRPGEFEEVNTNICAPTDAYQGEVRITDYSYTPALEDENSPEYQQFANQVISAVDDIYKNSELAPLYKGIEIESFRNINGSVIAEFDVHFTTTGNSTALQIADDILKNSLNRSKNATNFGVMQADPSHAFLVDRDECQNSISNDCDQNAICNNTIGSFECFCKKGFTGNGTTCTDINECSNSSLHNCSLATPGVTCLNTPGAFQCTCKAGFTGNGVICNATVSDHCLAGTHNCHPNAFCTSFPGPTFTCECKEDRNYYGNGTHCFVGCPVNHCENGGTCITSQIANICKCLRGFYGDRCELGTGTTSAPRSGLDKWVNVAVAFATICGTLLLFLCICCICLCRRRRRREDDEDSPRRYCPTRISAVVYLDTIDEDFTIPARRLRASRV